MDKKRSVAASSILASILLTLLKLVVGMLTGSIGILSEAAHSFLDLGAASLTYVAVKIGDMPPDATHPYGHGKVESISAFMETGLLVLTSIWIVYEAVLRFMSNKSEIEVTWYAFAVMGISILVDYSRSRALFRVATETKSQALEADALHFSSDILSSIVVIIGLVLTAYGIHKADAIAAIGVSFFVLHAAYVLGKRTIDVLIDTTPPGFTDQITDIILHTTGVLSIVKLRIRPVGVTAYIDLNIAVARSTAFPEVRHIIFILEQKIKKVFPEADISIQITPVALDTESITEHVQVIAQRHGLAVHDITIQKNTGGRTVNFDLEIDAASSFTKAHHIATRLENDIRAELGKDTEVNIHIEPVKHRMISGQPADTRTIRQIQLSIDTIARHIPHVSEVHHIEVKETEGGLFVSLHCIFADSENFEKVHEMTSRLEYLIRQKLPKVKKVLVHAEPVSEKE